MCSKAKTLKIEKKIKTVVSNNSLQKLERAKNLAATLLSNNDVTTGIKSQVQALGSGNPFTIKTTEESFSSVTVQGGRGI